VGVIALVPENWDSVWMPRHQILTRLARYFDVVWINPARGWQEHWHPKRGSHLQRLKFREVLPGFTVMTPGTMRPRFYRPLWLRRAMLTRTLKDARAYLARRKTKRLLLYLWRPEFAEALKLIPHDASCYHIDDEYSFADVARPNDPQEIELLRSVDRVIVHSQGLLKKKGDINPHTALIPNGVDYPAFATKQAEPPDLATVPIPRIGYVGVIKRQLDLGLLARLAHARPDWSFVLVGPVGNVSGKEAALAQLRALPNVHFLGYKPVNQLAAYVQYMDVCLMCYEVNDYTNCIYPLKLHEYLAAGRPTVASPIASVLDHSDIVTLARSDAEWLAGIARALAPPSPFESERRRRRAASYDWDILVEKLAQIFCERLNIRWPVDVTVNAPRDRSDFLHE
jgi:glycosyltransferase involved in cell wall biosynthesis